jgi:hypothetical protein
MAKALAQDHGLLESEMRETNLNRFMSHIGELSDGKQLRRRRWLLTLLICVGIQFSLIAVPISKQDG